MTSPVTLALTGDQHAHLQSFLFPGDHKEAVSVLLCSLRNGDRRHRLVVREIHDIPYDQCSVRAPDRVTWSPDYIADILDRAATESLTVVKVHSHPNGYAQFSLTDDEGDTRLLPMIRGWVEADLLHGSAVMLPDGRMFGRVWRNGNFESIACVSVAGDNLEFWHEDHGESAAPAFVASHVQAFDEGTIERLSRLSIAVVGASGTGSPVVEQLVRLGVGEVVLVDDDLVEDRNLNRILNSTMDDARHRLSKVSVLAAAIDRIGLGTRVVQIGTSLWDRDAVLSVAQCDVIFGCIDTIDGRYLLNTISSYYNIPYFDIGIRLAAERDGPRKGQIQEVCGTVNYIRPGRSSLMSRGLFTMEQVAADGLRRNDPAAHSQQLKDGYISGVQGRRPAVISVNMLGASLAVNEFLARLHPYREEPNRMHAEVTFSLASMEMYSEPERDICTIFAASVGRGDVRPLLGLLEFAERRVP